MEEIMIMTQLLRVRLTYWDKKFQAKDQDMTKDTNNMKSMMMEK